MEKDTLNKNTDKRTGSNRTIIFSVIALFIVSVFIILKVFDNKGNYSATNYYLDTVNEITIINERKSESEKALREIDRIILNINNTMSAQLPGSEVSKINNNAGIKPVKVDSDVFYVIKKSIYYSKITGGKFDITIGPLTSLWNIGNDKQRVPSEKEIKALLPLVNYRDIELDIKNSTVFLKRKGMRIDLGGIAKGYCADKIADYLKSVKIENAIINLGGNIYVLGKNTSGKDFNIGIQNPQEKKQDSIADISESDKSIVTSGIYERYIKKNGKVYHHMLNPTTGYPFENNLSSVTIISKKSIDGDALSTSTFGLGLKDGMKFIESLKDIDAVFITKDSGIYITEGLKNNFTITDKSYKLED